MKRKKSQNRQKVMAWVVWTIVGIILLVFSLVLVVSFLGCRFDVVSGESMEPNFKLGGLVVTWPTETEDVEVGDAILFRELNTELFICHRVIDIEETDNQRFFQTKGDANEYPDPDPVSSRNLIGKAVFYIPQVGNLAYFSRLHETPVVFMGEKLSMALLSVVVAGLIIVGIESKNIWEWTFNRELKKHRERIKKRRETAFRRRRRFA